MKNVKSFVYLLHKLGFCSIQEYCISFDSSDTDYANFEGGVFKLQYKDKSIIRNFIDKYEVVTEQKIEPADKPLYIYFCAGYPSAEVQFIPEAAKELEINLKVEYHGCIIRTLYSDEYGLEITDVQVEALEIEEQNKDAVIYYNNLLGEGWLMKLKNRAIELLENTEDDGLPF